MQKVIITGGAGFIGSAVIKHSYNLVKHLAQFDIKTTSHMCFMYK